MVIDNQAKRSFASADVNTIIVLFSSPNMKKETGLEETARFVMFKEPFEHIISPVIFEEIETAKKRKTTPEYRVNPIVQKLLLEDGCEIYDDKDSKNDSLQGRKNIPKTAPLIKIAKYIGNKWGGKYLRAPDIYWTILQKGKDKLVRLGDVAEVRRGITTGANEFFYLTDEKIKKWRIEDEFLRPVIKSPRECMGFEINNSQLKFKLFLCNKEKKQLQGTAAFEYIWWGESQGFHVVPSTRSRPRWWDLGKRRISPIISPSSISEILRTFRNNSVLADKRLYEIYPYHSTEAVHLATNSIMSSLFLELGSRTGLGEGLLDLTVYELADCLIVEPKHLQGVNQVIEEAKNRLVLPLREELQHKNRKKIDNIVFDALELTRDERDAVYEAVIKLVEVRLNKAESFNPSQIS